MKPPYLSTGEFAALHDVQAQTVRLWCVNGQIKGAVQVGDRWLVPRDAVRPAKGKPGKKR